MTTINQWTLLAGGMWPKAVIYYDPTNNAQYFCDTLFWMNQKSEKVWRIKKVIYDTSTFNNVVERAFAYDPIYDKLWEWSFVYEATDLATVQALQYNFS